MTRFWHVWVATLMASSMLVLPGHASAAAAISPGLAARGYSTQRALTGVEGARFGAWRRAGIAHTAGVGQSIYVSPAGSDRNPGTQLLPFRTLAHAQAVVRTLNRNMLGDINVYLESGTYYLSQSMKLDARDSGTNGYNVIWTAAPGATAVINGAQRVSGWTLTNPSKEIWSAAVPPGLTTRQIYVDGVRASLTTGRSPVGLKQTRMGYIATAPTMAGWRNPSGIEFVYTSEISLNTEAICPIGTIVGASITMAQPCWANSTRRRWNGVGFNSVNMPTYVEDAYEMLDQPGQFYLDSAAHRLYYIPRQGQDMQSADVEVPVLQTLVTGDGTSRAPIHNITFANLQFSYATWLQPSTPEGFSEIQTGYTVTGLTGYAKQGLCLLAPGGTCPYGTWSKEPGNIHFRYARDLSFLNDRFVHLGAAGLSLGDGSQYDNVEECVFTDISGNGLEIGDVDLPNAKANSQTIGNTVTNNHLYGIPVEYHGGVPILVGYAAHTLISHNQIDHTPYAGISLGWGGWLDKDRQPPVPNFSHDNLISNNLIFDFMQDLKDGGGVYTQGIQGWSMSTGLKVTGNVIHNQLDWGGALKADNGTTYVTYAGNVLYDNTYDWNGTHWDYRADPGTTRPMKDDPEALRGNWWQEGDPNSSTRGVVISGNTIITSPDQAPASVLANAGVQAPYSSVLLWRPVSPQVPSAPDQLSTLYAFNGTAYLTWHPSFAEGSSPVLLYTVSVCRGRAISNQGGCQKPALPPLMVTSGDLSTRGYAKVTGLTDGRPYTFLVSATNAVGTSTNSIESSEFWPRSGVPGLPERPSRVALHPGQDDVALLWYRPRNDPGVKLMAGTKGNGQVTRGTDKHGLLVLSYRITSSTGQEYDLTGHEQLINTNTGSRVLDVIGGLVPGQKYRFSISAVNPAGVGPATTTGWVRTHS